MPQQRALAAPRTLPEPLGIEAAGNDAGGKLNSPHDANLSCLLAGIDDRLVAIGVAAERRHEEQLNRLEKRFEELNVCITNLSIPVSPTKIRPSILGNLRKVGEQSTNTGNLNLVGHSLSCISGMHEIPCNTPTGNCRGSARSSCQSEKQTKHLSKLLDRRSARQKTDQETIFTKLINHPFFDHMVTLLIMLNVIVIGVQTEVRGRTMGEGDSHQIFNIIEYACVGFFTIELLLRVIGLGPRAFAIGESRLWNLFDSFLVISSILDLILDTGAARKNFIVRIFRTARVMRVIRAMRFFSELRIMVSMIISSLRSLLWLLVMLVIMWYTFGIIFTQGALGIVFDRLGESEDMDTLFLMYGAVSKSMYTLFMSMTGGISWGECVVPLDFLGAFYVVLFLLYIFFAMFSVLNIVTGVFVEGAIQQAELDRDVKIERERQKLDTIGRELRDLMIDLDLNGDNTVTYDEFVVALEDENLRMLFSSLGIDASETEKLWKELDSNKDGAIDIDEFMTGCMLLNAHGKAAGIQQSIARLHSQSNKLLASMVKMNRNTLKGIKHLTELLVSVLANDGRCDDQLSALLALTRSTPPQSEHPMGTSPTAQSVHSML